MFKAIFKFILYTCLTIFILLVLINPQGWAKQVHFCHRAPMPEVMQASTATPVKAEVEKTPYEILKVSLDRINIVSMKCFATGLELRRGVNFAATVEANILQKLIFDRAELRDILVDKPGRIARDVWGRETQREYQRHIHAMLFLSDSIEKWLLDNDVLIGSNKQQKANQIGSELAEEFGFLNEVRDVFVDRDSTLTQAWHDLKNNEVGLKLSLESTTAKYYDYDVALSKALAMTKTEFSNIEPKTL